MRTNFTHGLPKRQPLLQRAASMEFQQFESIVQSSFTNLETSPVLPTTNGHMPARLQLKQKSSLPPGRRMARHPHSNKPLRQC